VKRRLVINATQSVENCRYHIMWGLLQGLI